MIAPLDPRDPATAARLHRLQQVSYAVEQALLEVEDFFPLRLTADDIAREPDTFLGWFEGERLVGVVSFVERDELVDIGRMIVDPEFFRRGIAARLLEAVEARTAPGMRLTVSTGEKNHPAVRLYETRGYAPTARTVLSDGLVLLRFQKTLGGGPA